MPFARPTLTELRNQSAADIRSSLPGTDPLLRFSNLAVIGAILAGQAHLHYGYLDWISKQAIPVTATAEFLEAWAALKGVIRKSAAAASGAVTFSNSAPGTVVPEGTQLVRGDGVIYVSTADATVGTDGTVMVPAAALNASAASDCPLSTVLTLGSAIAGMQSNGSVTTAFTGGADVETDDALRTRMLLAYSSPPQGGASVDYVEWALAVPGVTRAWCALANGGIVNVWIMLDDVETAHGGFPQGTNGTATGETRGTVATGDQLIVANYIFPRRPVTALVNVLAPVQNTVDFTVANIASVSSDVKKQVSAAISEVFFRKGSPGGVIDLSDIESGIAAVAGTEGFVIVSPANNIVNPAGALPVLGSIDYN